MNFPLRSGNVLWLIQEPECDKVLIRWSDYERPTALSLSLSAPWYGAHCGMARMNPKYAVNGNKLLPNVCMIGWRASQSALNMLPKLTINLGWERDSGWLTTQIDTSTAGWERCVPISFGHDDCAQRKGFWERLIWTAADDFQRPIDEMSERGSFLAPSNH